MLDWFRFGAHVYTERVHEAFSFQANQPCSLLTLLRLSYLRNLVFLDSTTIALLKEKVGKQLTVGTLDDTCLGYVEMMFRK